MTSNPKYNAEQCQDNVSIKLLTELQQKQQAETAAIEGIITNKVGSLCVSIT